MPTLLTQTASSSSTLTCVDGPLLSAGMTVGAYEIEAEVGAGSMGQVYRAKHKRLGRHVALKVLRPEVVKDQSLVERFLQEGRAVNRINHANIVEVHDCVEELDPARVYCVMEFLEGQSLAERIQQRPSSIESIRSMGRQIASALTACHAAGVVHRDLKPENIFLLGRDGRDDWVKVLDFGIAKCVQPLGQLSMVQTAQGAVMGTPRYMAPEQIAGLDVDGRTDIYALGVILYELIAGTPPFDGATFGLLAATIINKPMPPLPRHTASGEPVPAELASLIAACLSKAPSSRPARMDQVEAALQLAPIPLIHVHRRPARAMALAGAVVAMAVVALWSTSAPAVQPLLAAVAQVVPALIPPVVVLEEVTLRVDTQPAGALVLHAVSGEPLGRTPLEVKMTRDLQPLPIRIELEGFSTLERTVSVESDQRLELTLDAPRKPARQPARQRPVTEGVLDPY